MYTGHHKSFLFFRIPRPSTFSFHSSKMGIYLFTQASRVSGPIARMQNKLCDVTKCLTTVAAGVLSC